MLKINLICLSTLLAFSWLAEATDFQSGSENVVEETVEQKDGKTVRRIRSGQVRGREGGARVGEIEEGEVNRVARRQKSLSLSSFGFGPYGSSDVGQGRLLYGFSYGHHREVSTTGEITADLLGVFNGHGSFWHGGIGFSFLPLTTNVSPVVGAALGFGWADVNKDKENVGGFSGQVNLGARLFRLSETQMEILANYTSIFESGSPGVYGVQLRVLY